METHLPEFNLTHMPAPGEVIRDDDSGLGVRFYRHAATGFDHLEVTFPGDPLTVIDRPATDFDKARFAPHWHAFEGGGQFEGQHRLETCAWADPGIVRDLHKNGIFTCEQLAKLPDAVVADAPVLGLLKLRQRAIDHLAGLAEPTTRMDDLARENAELRNRLEALEAAARPRPRRKEASA